MAGLVCWVDDIFVVFQTFPQVAAESVDVVDFEANGS
jgi:hypothetical protein